MRKGAVCESRGGRQGAGHFQALRYKLVREMNEELKKKGFLTIPGRVSRRYFEEKFYGLRDRQ